MRQYWLAVASAEHVARGVAGGFCQVCHGKQAPLKRFQQGDGLIYYSPSRIMGQKDGLQSFTALGFLKDNNTYQADMGNGFLPYRRDVDWQPAHMVAIHPLLQHLTFTRGKQNWGYVLRFGIIKIAQEDFQLIENEWHAVYS